MLRPLRRCTYPDPPPSLVLCRCYVEQMFMWEQPPQACPERSRRGCPPGKARSLLVWSGHSCPLPLTLMLTSVRPPPTPCHSEPYRSREAARTVRNPLSLVNHHNSCGADTPVRCLWP